MRLIVACHRSWQCLPMVPKLSKIDPNRHQRKMDGFKASFGQKCVDLGGLCPPVRFICCHLCIPLVRFISCPPARFISCHLFASSVVWKIDRNFQSTSRRGKRLFISVDGCCCFFSVVISDLDAWILVGFAHLFTSSVVNVVLNYLRFNDVA